MKPGYYVALRDTILTSPATQASHRLRVHKGDWLITDGDLIGRFDKDEELDWVPLEWVHGTPVNLDEDLELQLDSVVVTIAFSRLEAAFQRLVFVEPGEPTPDLPRPSLTQLGPYLRERRMLTAYSYRRS